MARKKHKVKKSRRIGPLLDPSATLSGPLLKRAAATLTSAEYGPKQRALTTQAANATTQGTAVASRASDYYRQLAEREQAQVARQSALSDMLKTDTHKIGTDTQAAFDKEAANAAAARTQGPAIQGTDQTSKVDAELAALRGLASTRQQATESSAAAQGANFSSLANEMSSVRGLRGGEVQDKLLTALANEQQKLRDQQTGLSSDRATARAANILKLRQQGFENVATLKTLGLKAADINATLAIAGQRSRDAAAGRKVTRANALTSAETSAGNTAAHIQSAERIAALGRKLRRDLAPTTAKDGTKLSAGQIAANQKFVSAAMNVAADYARLARRGWKGPKLAAHFRKAGAPAIVLNAGADIANFGYILPQHVRALEQAGYSIPASLRKTNIPGSKK
jgi:hypothetical protein